LLHFGFRWRPFAVFSAPLNVGPRWPASAVNFKRLEKKGTIGSWGLFHQFLAAKSDIQLMTWAASATKEPTSHASHVNRL
jgi:hypothetical protein